jgi:hypothetical protein
MTHPGLQSLKRREVFLWNSYNIYLLTEERGAGHITKNILK